VGGVLRLTIWCWVKQAVLGWLGVPGTEEGLKILDVVMLSCSHSPNLVCGTGLGLGLYLACCLLRPQWLLGPVEALWDWAGGDMGLCVVVLDCG